MTAQSLTVANTIEKSNRSIDVFLTEFGSRLPFALATVVIGALVFTWVQALTGKTDIAAFIGRKIVELGGYKASFANPLGWSVHLSVALSYAVAYTTVVSLPVFPQRRPLRLIAGAVSAVGLGVVTTLFSNPLISIAINVLAGNGWPEKVAALYTKTGVPLWNHLGFFTLAFLVILVLADIVRQRR